MKVIKFGGTCLASEDTLQRAAKVVKEEKEQKRRYREEITRQAKAQYKKNEERA